jgi:2-polyprenyl-3-methyl-5-hydroxy-6-metoxy-1,4-benzoquinol methylase
MTIDLTRAETHFEFGENWRDYLRHVDSEAIAEAERGLLKLVPAMRLRGARFLDIGCGSGLHTLAAVKSGIAQGLAIDIDRDSVAATRDLLAKLAPDAPVEVRELSVFDADPTTLGLFDVVYSWGVLHHTGAMWRAVEKAAALVDAGGIFALALYQKRVSCKAWAVEKKFYTRSPAPVRTLIRGAYVAALYLRFALRGQNPWRVVRDYKSGRGMNFHNDVHDWLGGYPYESATPAEVLSRLTAGGFELVSQNSLPAGLGLLGTGCAEYVFRRSS